MLFYLLMALPLFAEIKTIPHFVSLENLEMKYALKDNYYVFEKRENLTHDIEGVAYFFPNFLIDSTVSYSTRLVDKKVDAYVFTSNTPDLCKNNIDRVGTVTGEDLANLKNMDRVKYLSYRDLVRIDFHDNINDANFWFYVYPKIKRDYIFKKGNNYYPYAFPVVVNFSFRFDQSSVDSYVANHTFSQSIKSRCENNLTYLDKEGVNSLLEELKPFLQNHQIPVHYAEDYSSYSELSKYIKAIENNASVKGSASVKRQATALAYKVNSAKERARTTKNLCLYINHLIESPAYKNGYNKPLTITNSCPIKGTIDQYNRYVNYYITGYKISGRVVKTKEKEYVIDNQNRVYEFLPENGCDFKDNEITDEYLTQNILSLPAQGYYIDIHDWDNDARTAYDCLIVEGNRANKMDDFNQSDFIFKTVNFPIKKIGNIVIFDKEASSSKEEVSSSQQSSSTQSSEQKSSSSSASSQCIQTSPIGNIKYPGEEDRCTPAPSSSSSSSAHISSSSSSSSSHSSSSNSSSSISIETPSSTSSIPSEDQIAAKLIGKSLPINGYFIHYDSSDPFGWVYIGRESRKIYKLNGMDQEGHFNWTDISNKVKIKKDGDHIIFQSR